MEQVATLETTRKLPVQLTENEVRLRGIELANMVRTHVDLIDAKKDAMKDFKDKIDGVNDQILELKDAVRNGVEVREVDIEIRKNMYLGSVTIIRMDTGDVVETCMMNEREMQGQFDLDGNGE